LEPKVTEALIAMIIEAPGGKAQRAMAEISAPAP
jgi:hypothetical protein